MDTLVGFRVIDFIGRTFFAAESCAIEELVFLAGDTLDPIQKGVAFGAGLAKFGVDVVDGVFLADSALELFEVEVVRVDTSQTLLSVPVLSNLFIACRLLLLVE